ncbi:hypothetical protein MBAV_006425 [Candidatus Magnetobacterium bavaricum]|uniref:Uncharacterized protein n=1 Tax=Candidatus Magnetobacterium bavaricum TaxID=29290 RepID=A0A0F3GHM3_9BACT|nr:hypothetical protein MBAV_006425 [Candidatus Magnetobacterium bavaricum]
MSLIFKISHSPKTSISSFLHSSADMPVAHTPAKPGISANTIPLSKSLYVAFLIASYMYCVIILNPPCVFSIPHAT